MPVLVTQCVGCRCPLQAPVGLVEFTSARACCAACRQRRPVWSRCVRCGFAWQAASIVVARHSKPREAFERTRRVPLVADGCSKCRRVAQYDARVQQRAAADVVVPVEDRSQRNGPKRAEGPALWFEPVKQGAGAVAFAAVFGEVDLCVTGRHVDTVIRREPRRKLTADEITASRARDALAKKAREDEFGAYGRLAKGKVGPRRDADEFVHVPFMKTGVRARNVLWVVQCVRAGGDGDVRMSEVLKPLFGEFTKRGVMNFVSAAARLGFIERVRETESGRRYAVMRLTELGRSVRDVQDVRIAAAGAMTRLGGSGSAVVQQGVDEMNQEET